MLIAAFLVWLSSLFGGGADAAAQFLAAARDGAREHISDHARRKAADTVFGALETFRREVAIRREAARTAVSKDMSARDGNPRPALESLATDAAASDAQLVELRFRLRDTMTRDEWQRVFPKMDAAAAPK